MCMFPRHKKGERRNYLKLFTWFFMILVFHFKEKVACMMKFEVNYHHAKHNLAAATMDQLIVPAVTVPKYVHST